MHLIVTLATTETAGQGLLAALGIDWRALIVNAAAFLALAYLLARFVYPALTKALDAKQAEFESAARLEQEAKRELEKAQSQAARAVRTARDQAGTILADARIQAQAIVKDAGDQAAIQAERILAENRQQLQRDIAAAQEELKQETARLAVAAAEAVLAEKIDDRRDAAIIARALETQK